LFSDAPMNVPLLLEGQDTSFVSGFSGRSAPNWSGCSGSVCVDLDVFRA